MRRLFQLTALLLVAIVVASPAYVNAEQQKTQEQILISNLEPVMGRAEDGQVEELMIHNYLMELSKAVSGAQAKKSITTSDMQMLDCRYIPHPESSSLSVMGIDQLISSPFREKYFYDENGRIISTLRNGHQKRGYCLYETVKTDYSYTIDNADSINSIEYVNHYTGWEFDGSPEEEETVHVDLEYGTDGADIILKYTITDIYAKSYETMKVYKDGFGRIERIEISRDRYGDTADVYYDNGEVVFEYREEDQIPCHIITKNMGHFSGDWEEEYLIEYDEDQKVTFIQENVTKAFGMDNPGMQYETKVLYNTRDF